MKRLYAPWRTSHARDITFEQQNPLFKKNTCVFCFQVQELLDEKNWIIKRNTHSFVILNKYPYNAGHLLILPYEHIPTLHTLSIETRTEIMEEISLASNVLTNALLADGYNIGINSGNSAGGSIPEHLHVHIVPRFKSDNNFMPITANTKVISFDMNEVYEKIKQEYAQLKNNN